MPSSGLLALLLALTAPTPPTLTATRATRAPLIDGRLDDDVWRTAPPSTAFTQQIPFDGQAPSERTTLRVLYDDDSVYVGMDCEQLHAPIVERLTRRDADSESDWVWVQIDSRNDGKSAFMFALNVSGVMADATIINQTVVSFDWDETWEGRAGRTDTGWSAEFRIPLRVLRFESRLPVQSWGLQVKRLIAQQQETDAWAYAPREVATPITYFGRLDRLENLDGRGPLEIRPFVLGFGRRLSETESVLARGMDGGLSGGLDLKLHLGWDLTVDAALNPDFAQVEADQVVLNLSNYEIVLPEKRPLFLEGTDAFAFPLPVFYSRRIGSAPLPPTLPTGDLFERRLVEVPRATQLYGAVKLAGRLTPDWSVGMLTALAARNEVSVETLTTGLRSRQLASPLTAFNVVRVRRELRQGAHVGLIGTGATRLEDDEGYPLLASGNELCPSGQEVTPNARCFHDGYLLGADALWRSGSGHYLASAAYVHSWIVGGTSRQQLDGTIIGSGSSAPAGTVRIAKEGGRGLFNLEYAGAGRRVDYNDVGYMQRQNLHEVKALIGYRTYEPGVHTLERRIQVDYLGRRNLSGVDLGQVYGATGDLRFRSFWMASASANLSPVRFDDRETGDGLMLERGAWIGWKLAASTDPRRRGVLVLDHQTQLIELGALSTAAQGSLLLHVRPHFDVEVLPQVTWSWGEWRFVWPAPVDGTAPGARSYPFGRLRARSVGATLRLSYTFTPRLSLQAYAQVFLATGNYTDVRAVDVTSEPAGVTIRRADVDASPRSALQPSQTDFQEAALNVSVVLRWEYRLGSTMFLVYSRSQTPAVGGLMGPAGFDLRALGNRASADVLLFKLSYWWGA